MAAVAVVFACVAVSSAKQKQDQRESYAANPLLQCCCSCVCHATLHEISQLIIFSTVFFYSRAHGQKENFLLLLVLNNPELMKIVKNQV